MSDLKTKINFYITANKYNQIEWLCYIGGPGGDIHNNFSYTAGAGKILLTGDIFKYIFQGYRIVKRKGKFFAFIKPTHNGPDNQDFGNFRVYRLVND